MGVGKDRRIRGIRRRVAATSEKLADLEGARERVSVLELPDGLDPTCTKGRAWLAVHQGEAAVVALPPVMTEDAWLSRFSR